MQCPACNSTECRRSRRRTLLDYFGSVAGSVPWRCTRCNSRFHCRLIPLNLLFVAHCAICGNRELKRISGEHPESLGAPLWRFLGVPAFRCIPCRNKFFSVLPLSKEVEDNEFKMAS